MGLQLVTRQGCHLCDDAASALRSLGLDFDELDVDADPELLRLYDFRVPVILRGGEVLAEGEVKAGRLAQLLDRGRGAAERDPG